MSEPDFTAARVLTEAVRLLGCVDAGRRSLDDALDFENREPELRRTLSMLLFALFRSRNALEAAIDGAAAKPPRGELRRLLLAALTQMRFATGIAPESAANVAVDCWKRRGGAAEAKFVNYMLRKLGSGAWPDVPALPETVRRRWRGRFGDAALAQFDELYRALPPTVARACGGFKFPDNWRPLEFGWSAGLRYAEIPAGTPFPELAARLTAGEIYLQDPAAAATATLPDFRGVRRALDLCAAPGGKALIYREFLPPEAELVCADRSAARQKLTAENFARRGLTCQIVVGEPEKWEKNGFDLVCADAPCSNTGVFRHRPDALWRFSEKALAETVALQRRILDAAAELVAPGGQLLYSTCSLEPEENFEQARAFERRHDTFRPVAERQLCPASGHDGAYAVLWRKR